VCEWVNHDRAEMIFLEVLHAQVVLKSNVGGLIPLALLVLFQGGIYKFKVQTLLVT
jgi:hypothetical protein